MDPDSVRAVARQPHGGTDDPDLLEFSANVNPETPPGVDSVYESALADARRYPDDSYPEYREAAADAVGCQADQVVPTAGGLEAIRLAIATHTRPGDTVLVPAPSFSEYAREVRLQGGSPEFVPAPEILDARTEEAALAVVCNPNNPTGRLYDHDELRSFARRCSRTGTTLLVDEAFLGFTAEPSMAGESNVIVARSLTKLYGLPGIRMGYAVATGEELEALSATRRAWSLGSPAAMVGTHCLGCEGFAERTRKRVKSERRRLREALTPTFDVEPSAAPFLLLETGERRVGELVERCRDSGIAIRDATTFRGLDTHVRVAVRTPAENDRLIEVLTDG